RLYVSQGAATAAVATGQFGSSVQVTGRFDLTGTTTTDTDAAYHYGQVNGEGLAPAFWRANATTHGAVAWPRAGAQNGSLIHTTAPEGAGAGERVRAPGKSPPREPPAGPGVGRHRHNRGGRPAPQHDRGAPERHAPAGRLPADRAASDRPGEHRIGGHHDPDEYLAGDARRVQQPGQRPRPERQHERPAARRSAGPGPVVGPGADRGTARPGPGRGGRPLVG